MIPKLTDFNAASIPVLNKILDDINLEKPKITYTATLPTANNVNKGELHVYDDGDTIQRMYFKTHRGTLSYLNLGSDEDFPAILPIARGGTFNNSYTAGQFLIFDGTRITSSIYDGESFSPAESGVKYLKIDQTTPQTVVNGAPIFDSGLRANEKIGINCDPTATYWIDIEGGDTDSKFRISTTDYAGIVLKGDRCSGLDFSKEYDRWFIGTKEGSENLYLQNQTTHDSMFEIAYDTSITSWYYPFVLNTNSATAFLVEQDGVKDNTFIVDTTNGRVGIGGAPDQLLELTGTDIYLHMDAVGYAGLELDGSTSCGIDFSIDDSSVWWLGYSAENEYLNLWGNSIERFRMLNAGTTTWLTNMTVDSTNELHFRDAAIYIASLDDGHLDLTADVSIDLNGAVVGSSTFSGTNFTSTVAIGTPPYACTSTTLNTNLNADLLDGHDSAYFQTALTTGNMTATSPIAVDQTRQVIGGAVVLSHAATAGNIHLPASGSANQILKNSGAAGTGAWGTVTENSGALAAVTTIGMSGQLTNTLAIGTSPFAVTSTTVNTNLNADLWDGYQFGDYLDQAVKTASTPQFGLLGLGGAAVANQQLTITNAGVTAGAAPFRLDADYTGSGSIYGSIWGQYITLDKTSAGSSSFYNLYGQYVIVNDDTTGGGSSGNAYGAYYGVDSDQSAVGCYGVNAYCSGLGTNYALYANAANGTSNFALYVGGGEINTNSYIMNRNTSDSWLIKVNNDADTGFYLLDVAYAGCAWYKNSYYIWGWNEYNVRFDVSPYPNPAGGPSLGLSSYGWDSLYMLGDDNETLSVFKINATQANVTASDVFIDFQSTTGSEGSIAGTAVAGVIAYNTFTGSHYTQIEDKTGIEPCMVLEAVGNAVVSTEGEVTVNDLVGMEVKKVKKRLRAAEKEQVVTSRVCSTRKSKIAWGVYGGTDNLGRDTVLAIGTGKAIVANKGEDIEVGDYLMSSDIKGCVEKQDDDVLHNYTLCKSLQEIKWKSGEKKKSIAVTYHGG